jgi:hypothetical protein
LSLSFNPWLELEAEARREVFQLYEELYMQFFVNRHGKYLQGGFSGILRDYNPETGSTTLAKDFALSTLRSPRWDKETMDLTGTPDHDNGIMTITLCPPTCVVHTCRSLRDGFSGTFVDFCSEGESDCTVFQEIAKGDMMKPTEKDTNPIL